ncbi:MAG: serine/threonine protein kinase [Candidatus Obscuribacter sp.]|nr:serine/threonine protein kinase [Candidatus Obscuribacter sp.]MBP6592253.1 serine/threonine protein kinase [Candidatus Obscuribacter sp.]MBP7575613.1 serine/threonine protein kinase [Candidatus Obscuribacter sp.]
MFQFFSPVWAIFVPIAAIFICYFSSLNPQAVFLALGLGLTSILCLIATVFLSDKTILLSQSGIKVPLLKVGVFSPNRDEIAWSSIKKAKIQSAAKITPDVLKGRTLILELTDGEKIKLNLACLGLEATQQLLLALTLWLPEAARTEELMQLKDALSAPMLSQGDLTYTDIWQAELESRYTTTAFMPLEPGHKLKGGNLEVLKQLAFGGLSAVYLCQLNKLDLIVLKESVVPLNSKESLKNKAAEMFKREASLLVNLDHPQLVKVVDFFTENDRTYLLLGYQEGLNLRQLIREQGPQSENRVIEIAISLIQPLNHLHSLSPPVVHRDISPENIILKEDDTAVLIDFGAANEYLGTATGTMVGKQCYVSPEQFKGKASTESDLYSLGATLYYLLTGSDPTPISVSSPKEVRPEISEKLDSIIQRLTALEIEDRITTAHELEELLVALRLLR